MAVLIPTMSPPTDADLAALADQTRSPLPTSYLEFVRLHDGASPEDNSIKTLDNEVGVSRFIPVSEAAKLGAQIDGFPADVIPLAEDDCGNYFYVSPSDGAVFFWDHELEGADERVATSVADFADSLNPFDASSVKLAPGQVISAWIDPSFKPEF